MALAANANTGLGGAVLYVDGGLNDPGKAGHVVHILGEDGSGVAVAVLGRHGIFHRLFKALAAHDGQHRHHLLHQNERMVGRHLADGKAASIRHMHADGLQNAGGILAHPLFVHLVAAALLGLQHDVHQLFGLGLVQQVGTLLLQLVQQAVVGGVHGEHFLLCKAEDVVIERSAFVDLAACQLDVCGLVHDDGRVACTGTDALFAAAQQGVHHAHATGACHQADLGVCGHLVHILHGRLTGHGNEVCRAARLDDGGIQRLQAVGRHPLCAGVHVEHHGVAACDHADGVVDDGLGRVGGGGDGADHTKGCVLFQHQARVTALGFGGQAFGAGGLVDDGQMFFHLVLIAAHAGLFHDLVAPLLHMCAGTAADGFNDALAVLDLVVGRPVALGFPCSLHCVVYVLEHAAVACCTAGCSGIGCRGGACLCTAHTGKHLLDDRFNFLRTDIHGFRSFP